MDSVGERWLCHSAPLCCASEASFFQDGQEVTNVPKFHPSPRGSDHDRPDALLRNFLESKVDFRVSAHSQFVNLQVEGARRLSQIAQLVLIRRGSSGPKM